MRHDLKEIWSQTETCEGSFWLIEWLLNIFDFQKHPFHILKRQDLKEEVY